LFSIQAQGLWSLRTENLLDTGLLVCSLEGWLSKDRHGLIRNRPKAQGEWGTANNREWGIHLLQSFNGIGPEVAGRIYDQFDGVPMRWTVDKIELMGVKGVGKVRAEKMIEALEKEVNGDV
jgi:ERCC4-type nuclease